MTSAVTQPPHRLGPVGRRRAGPGQPNRTAAACGSPAVDDGSQMKIIAAQGLCGERVFDMVERCWTRCSTSSETSSRPSPSSMWTPSATPNWTPSSSAPTSLPTTRRRRRRPVGPLGHGRGVALRRVAVRRHATRPRQRNVVGDGPRRVAAGAPARRHAVTPRQRWPGGVECDDPRAVVRSTTSSVETTSRSTTRPRTATCPQPRHLRRSAVQRSHLARDLDTSVGQVPDHQQRRRA